MWFNRGTMSTAAPAPTAVDHAHAEAVPAKPEEAQSRPVARAEPPVPPAGTVCVANFNDAAKADRAVADLRALGLADEDVHLLSDLEQRRELLGDYKTDRPAIHTQAGVGAAIFGAVGAVMLSLGALILLPEPPGMEWFFIIAFTVGILGACGGGFVGWWAFRPADDPQDPLSEAIASAGPAVAVLDADRLDANGSPISLGRIARTLVRAGGSCRYLSGAERADAHPGDTRGEHFKDAPPQAAPEGRPTAAPA